MSDQWYYRLFDEEFGPMQLDELKQLAEFGTISAADEVRSSSSSSWVTAASVAELGLASDQSQTAVIACDLSNTDASLPVIKQVTDEWFCQLGGQELGPMTFEELVEYVENEQLTADDQVKLGADGKWRRVGSIGKLVAVIPYKAVEKNIVPTPAKSKTPAVEQPVIDDDDLSNLAMEMDDLPDAAPDEGPASVTSQAAYEAAYEEAKAKIAESMMAQAEQAYRQAEEQAKAQVAWATGPKADRHWWGWANGVEFGPVEFQQVFGLAKSGQLKPNDLIRNGQFAQFGPSANVPGLFIAVGMLARAAEVLALAKSQADAAVKLAMPANSDSAAKIPVVSPRAASKPEPAPSARRTPPKSDPVIDIDELQQMMGSESVSPTPAPSPNNSRRSPTPQPEPRVPEPRAWGSPAPAPANNSAPSTPAVSRPVVPAKKPETPVKRSGPSFLSGMLGQLKEPKTIGSLVAIALVALFFGWGYLPKSRAADIRHYQALKQVLEEVRKARTNPSVMLTLKPKATKLGKEIAEAVKKQANRDDPAKQCLLWAARDELPRLLSASPESLETAEKGFASRLHEAAVELGLEKRSAITIAQTAVFPDD